LKVQGKTIVVTGGGNGIGRELVLNLLGRGARVAAVDISEAGLAETAAKAAAGEKLSTHTLSITDRLSVEALPESVIAKHGQVDGLINCAGIIQPFVRLKDLEYDAIERVMNVNFWGVVHMVKTFLPILLTRPVGHILNISSMGGFCPVPGQTIYGASKAAVKLLTEGLYAECLGTNVAVTVAFPGAIATNISKNSGVRGRRQGAEVQDDAAGRCRADHRRRDGEGRLPGHGRFRRHDARQIVAARPEEGGGAHREADEGPPAELIEPRRV
jgi:NAD(P)-dependent dehydrogenase (short-subunit alcohol dehydrogenase family)